MKKILIAALVVSTAAVAVEGFAAPNASDAIKQVFVALDRCLADNDAKCVGELLVDDATFAAPDFGSRIVKSKAQVVKTLGELMGAPAPNMKGAKRTHSVENVRMIGEDHAVVDASIAVAGVKPAEGEAADAPGSYHAVAVMVLKGDKWLFEDLRSYVVQPEKKPASPSKN
jgi:uncharacterized protein (TIGR02246 family)